MDGYSQECFAIHLRLCQSLSVWCFSSFMYDETNKKTNLPIILRMKKSIIPHVMWFLVTKFYSVVKKNEQEENMYIYYLFVGRLLQIFLKLFNRDTSVPFSWFETKTLLMWLLYICRVKYMTKYHKRCNIHFE